MGGLRKFQPVLIIITLLTTLWISACASSSPTAAPTTAAQNYIFSAYVESAVTDQNIPNAHVIIHVANKAPLEGFTDVNGYVRIPFATSYAGKPARLFIEIQGYEKHRQEINLSKEMLPDIIRLNPLSAAGNPPNEFTEEPATATIEPKTLTTLPTEQSTEEAFVPPTPTESSPPTDTPAPTSTPTNIPAPTDTPTSEPPAPDTPTTAPDLTGRLAIPLLLGTTPKVYIANTNGELLGDLDIARQPDYTLDGTKLIVNGDGGDLDKLRIAGPTGLNWYEIGDPSLGGHSHPTWSPSGDQVIYDDGTVDAAGWHIFRCGCDDRVGEGERIDAATGPIVGANPLYPLWTTNESFIFRACRTWGGDGGDCGIWLMQGKQGEPEKLTNSPNHIPTDVYRNMVVYTSEQDGNRNIFALNIDTGDIKQLTSHPASDGLATISPDGQTVAFLSNRGGPLAIWHVSIKGGSPKKMFDIPPAWGILREDGWFEEKLSWGKA